MSQVVMQSRRSRKAKLCFSSNGLSLAQTKMEINWMCSCLQHAAWKQEKQCRRDMKAARYGMWCNLLKVTRLLIGLRLIRLSTAETQDLLELAVSFLNLQLYCLEILHCSWMHWWMCICLHLPSAAPLNEFSLQIGLSLSIVAFQHLHCCCTHSLLSELESVLQQDRLFHTWAFS